MSVTKFTECGTRLCLGMVNKAVMFGVMVAVASGCGEESSESTTYGEVSLANSKFEIDTNANLVVDETDRLDWATVEDAKQSDTPSGQTDNSFKGGSKEDDLCPGVEAGSIPNNKSDLKTFGVYNEASPDSAGFLHLFWSRVQDPSGTTLMDFELNQSSERCANGINPVRTAGDFLLEYRLEQGGATATIKVREWSGAAWGEAKDLTAAGAATGTINSSSISAASSDGLGSLDPRTFGEASINLDYLLKPDKCVSFGSAFVKSRSSDAFTSALKDFIAPVAVNITNCGKVVIRKKTEPAGATDTFGFTHTLATDPATAETTFSLGDGQAKEFTNVLFGTGYTVREDDSTKFDLKSIDCSASKGVTPTVNLANRTVTFDIDNETDTVDCTYTNRARGKIVIEKITDDGAGTFNFVAPLLGGFSLTTTAPGAGGKGSRTFDNLVPGTYAVSEAVPAGWKLVSATCTGGVNPQSIAVAAGQTITCTFVNARNRGAIKIVKTRMHAANGPGAQPHAGVTFLVTGGNLMTPILVVTGPDGTTCLDSLLLSSFVGGYTVTEVLPTGYVPAGPLAKPVSVTAAANCPAGDVVMFANIPLTNITVSVDSQIDGGTASTITCTGAAAVNTGANGDGTLTLKDLVPGTYTCTVVVN